MKNSEFKLTDKAGDKKFFTIVPNFVIDNALSVYELSLYLFMKKVCGESGSCWMTPGNIAKRLGIAPGSVRKFQKALLERGWIKKIGIVGKTKPTIEYAIVDLWQLNAKYYAKKEKSPDDFSHRKDTGCVIKDQPVILESAPDDNKEERSKEDLSNKIKYIYARYKEKIHQESRLTNGAKVKIKLRLKTYKNEELIRAIDNFSENKWWMENNSFRGVAWFFHSDERIDQFLTLRPNKKSETDNKYSKLQVIKD